LEGFDFRKPRLSEQSTSGFADVGLVFTALRLAIESQFAPAELERQNLIYAPRCQPKSGCRPKGTFK
jgi:hypothetical protein